MFARGSASVVSEREFEFDSLCKTMRVIKKRRRSIDESLALENCTNIKLSGLVRQAVERKKTVYTPLTV